MRAEPTSKAIPTADFWPNLFHVQYDILNWNQYKICGCFAHEQPSQEVLNDNTFPLIIFNSTETTEHDVLFKWTLNLMKIDK